MAMGLHFKSNETQAAIGPAAKRHHSTISEGGECVLTPRCRV